MMDDSAVPPFAQLYYSWDELDVLGDLVDAELARLVGSPRWPILNSLRTSIREAQYGLRHMS